MVSRKGKFYIEPEIDKYDLICVSVKQQLNLKH